MPPCYENAPAPKDKGEGVFLAFGLSFLQKRAHKRDEHAAGRVSKRHDKHIAKGSGAPHTRNGKIVHIGNTVLKAAEDKDRNAKEQRKVR